MAIERFTSAYNKTYYIKKTNNDENRASALVPPQTSVDSTHKIDYMQTLPHARNEMQSWFGKRFRDFTAQPRTELSGNGGGATIISTAPFDQHFLSALVAPRALLIHGGFWDSGTNPEGMFLNYLAANEVYKFLESENRLGIKIYMIGHEHNATELLDLIEFSDSVFRSKPLVKDFKAHPYPLADPRSYDDYRKLNWAAPGAPETIADIVEALKDAAP
jgi:hypothetical protein